MSRNWRWLLVLGYPLLIVNLFFAALYAWLWCGGRDWKVIEGCLTFIPGKRKMFGDPGGQGWSPIVGFADAKQRARADLRVHEFTHVVQEMWFALLGLVAALIVLQVTTSAFWATLCLFSGGPLFALVYGGSFVWGWLKTRRGWKQAYYEDVFEKMAYERQARYLASYPDERETYWGHSG